MEIDHEMWQEYINEAEDYIQQIEPILLYLESNSSDKSLIDECFRNIHSLKGAAGYMGLTKTSKLAHKIEELLEEIRSGSISVDEDIISVLFSGVDRLKLLVRDVSKEQQESHEISDILGLIEEAIIQKQKQAINKDNEDIDDNSNDFVEELSEALSNSLKEVLEDKELAEEDSEAALMSLYEEQMGELINRLNKVLSSDDIILSQVASVLNEMKRLVHYIGANDLLERIKKAHFLIEDKGDRLTGKAAKEFRRRIKSLIEGKQFQEDENIFSCNKAPQTNKQSKGKKSNKDRDLNLNTIEEDDEELYKIFLDFLKEQSYPLANIPDKLDIEWVTQCQESIKKIKSSANYMDYQDLVRLLDEWEERLTEMLSTSSKEDHFEAQRLRQLWDKMCQIVPGLGDIIFEADNKTDGQDGELQYAQDVVEEALDELFSDVKINMTEEKSSSLKQTPKKITPPKDIVYNQEKDEQEIDIGLEEFNKKTSFETKDKHLKKSDISVNNPILTDISHSVRVDLEKLEDLMDGVGELVVLRAGISRVAGQLRFFYQRLLDTATLPPKELRPLRSMIYLLQEQAEGFSSAVHRMQDIVMRLRMLPIGHLFNKYNRLVRDLSRRLKKDVNLDIDGSETSLDKRVLEEISEPIAHIIRNAVDHGIESPDTRLKVGKPKTGTISIKAFQEGNYVYIKISDDGKGLDKEALLAKAITMGFISKQQASNMDTKQVWELVFIPGMSTAVEVSDTSGRGVGLDVVKRSIEKLGGEIHIESQPNRGTTFLMKIPLTLAIIQAMVIRVGSQMMAIPMSCVEETVRFPISKVSSVEGFELISVRQNTLPLIRLNKIFKFSSNNPIESEQDESKYLFAAIVKKGDYKIALAVDALMGQQEVVIKPLSDYLTEQPGFSGATLLADGSIALVLDISAVLERAKTFRYLEQQMWIKDKVNADNIKGDIQQPIL